MIKLIIFDLDGVLIDSREFHYEALNHAIEKVAGMEYKIGIEEHLSTYDGLPTTQKLKLLTKEKKLPQDLHQKIWETKQKETIRIFDEELQYDERMRSILNTLKRKGYTLGCASNSIRNTVKIILLRLGLIEYFDFWVSNQDVSKPKPHHEMYFKCMLQGNAKPRETLIIEDSHIGRQAVIDSGAYLLAVENTSDVTLEKIMSTISDCEKKNEVKNKPISWRSKEMNVLIPMAGAGKRFSDAGYTFPKPLIEINNKPMIQIVVENLNIDATFVFIVQKEHNEKYNLKTFLNLIKPNCKIVVVDELTNGAACTTLLAKDYINNDNPLLIANSDQFVKWNSNECLYAWSAEQIDGGILSFKATHPKWSYAKLDSNGFVCEVAEKNPISDIATVGIYYWRRGSDYVKYAEQMIEKNVQVNNEFYVCPVFNEAIQDNKKIRIKMIEKMWGLGTPEDLDYFLKHYPGVL